MATARTRTKRVTRQYDDERVQAFRAWIRSRIESTGQSLNSIEAEAGIPGNALGKFLRGERGSRHSLSPLHISRLAPVLGVSEEQMLARAGHITHQPDEVSVERAILADTTLDTLDKRFLIRMYRKMSGTEPD